MQRGMAARAWCGGRLTTREPHGRRWDRSSGRRNCTWAGLCACDETTGRDRRHATLDRAARGLDLSGFDRNGNGVGRCYTEAVEDKGTHSVEDPFAGKATLSALILAEIDVEQR